MASNDTCGVIINTILCQLITPQSMCSVFKQGQKARLFSFYIWLWLSPTSSDYYFLASIYVLGKTLNQI